MQQISISELLEQRPVIHKIQFDLKEQRKQAIRDKIVLEDLTRSRLKLPSLPKLGLLKSMVLPMLYCNFVKDYKTGA